MHRIMVFSSLGFLLVFGNVNGNVNANAALTTFTDRTAWETAVGSFTSENFNATPETDPIPNNTVFDVGAYNVFYTTSGGIDETNNFILDNDSLASIDGTIFLSLMVDIGGPDTTTALELRFDAPIGAFAADWNAVSNTSSLTSSAGGMSINLSDLLGPAPAGFTTPFQDGGFLGFTSDTLFSTITFSAAIGDVFVLDNTAFSTATTPIPVPSTAGLFGTGLLGLLAYAWWRKPVLT